MTNLQSSAEANLINMFPNSLWLKSNWRLELGFVLVWLFNLVLLYIMVRKILLFFFPSILMLKKVILTTSNQHDLKYLSLDFSYKTSDFYFVVKYQRVRSSGISMNVFLHHECQEVDQSGNLEMIQFSTVSSFISWNKEKQEQWRNRWQNKTR